MTDGTYASVEFNFCDASPEAGRAGVLLRFNTDGALVSVSADVSMGSAWPRVNSLGSVTTIQPEKFIVLGNDGAITSARTALNTKLRNLSGSPKFIGVGNHAYPSGSLSDVTNKLAAYWNNVKARCLFVPGTAENSTNAGVAFFNYFAIPRYRVIETEFADLFIVNTGFNTAWAQTELANAGTLISSTQFTWLRAQLAASTKKHKWVVWNEAPYSSVASSGVDETAALTALRTIPLKAWGATALLAGGKSILERLEVNGLLILASGSGGGVALDTLGTVSPYSQFVNATDYGYWEANVTELSVEFVCKSTDGVILDRYYQSL